MAQLTAARVRGDVSTFLDLEVPRTVPRSGCADGLLPVRALVIERDGELVGEILISVSEGYLSGLEFAWFTDEAPTEWPSPE